MYMYLPPSLMLPSTLSLLHVNKHPLLDRSVTCTCTCTTQCVCGIHCTKSIKYRYLHQLKSSGGPSNLGYMAYPRSKTVHSTQAHCFSSKPHPTYLLYYYALDCTCIDNTDSCNCTCTCMYRYRHKDKIFSIMFGLHVHCTYFVQLR